MGQSGQVIKEKRKLGAELVVLLAVLAALAVSVVTVTLNATEVGNLFGHGEFLGDSTYDSSSWYGDPNYLEVDICQLHEEMKGSWVTINSKYKYRQLIIEGYVISRGENELLLGCDTGAGIEAVVIAQAISVSGLVGEVGDKVEVRGLCMGAGTGSREGLLIMDRCLIKKIN